MSESFIYVKPAVDPSRVKVLTELLNELEIPVYIAAHPDGSLVDEDNPAPVIIKAQDLTHETDIVTILNEISGKLSVLIKYEAMLHKVDLEENL